ncbi:CsiV family protein [Thiohalorhabdus methylotrophus]|uniref:CsiV family protein n=1 Tax=Thiohalorhabdus methylotrophus TaxID=3242694 RepID=A0ABV4TY01_9GAMM
MRHFSLLVLALGSALAAGAAWGASEDLSREDRIPYIVRYLVFQHQDYWDDPLRVAGPVKDKKEPESEGEGLPDPTAGEDPMDKLWDRLSESADYRPLIQGLAVPFAAPRKEAEPIPLRGAWPASIRSGFAGLGEAVDRPIRVALGGDWLPPGMAGDWDSDRIQGSLTFYKGRYAHLEVNLEFTEQRRWMPWGIDVRHHTLQQSRRLLPNRFYYFDHPRFGVIARIERME